MSGAGLERNLNDAISNAERGAGVSGQPETCQGRGTIDIFLQRENLKSAAKARFRYSPRRMERAGQLISRDWPTWFHRSCEALPANLPPGLHSDR